MTCSTKVISPLKIISIFLIQATDLNSERIHMCIELHNYSIADNKGSKYYAIYVLFLSLKMIAVS